MTVKFEGEAFGWRGPAPFLFVALPDEVGRQLKALASVLSYGWGCIPVQAKTGSTAWTTSLMPKDGRYLLPVRMVVQRTEGIEAGDTVDVTLEIAGV